MFNINKGGPVPKPDNQQSDKQTKLTRPQIIGVLNAIIDLYFDAPLVLPKVRSGPRILPPKVPPLIVRVPRVPDKLVLPENKQRSDAVLDTLDTLRTCVKYGLFERDALRREVAFLKQMVDDLGGDV